VCWEIFPIFGKPTIGDNQQRWDSVALGFEPAVANCFDAQSDSPADPVRAQDHRSNRTGRQPSELQLDDLLKPLPAWAPQHSELSGSP
jgi:hypothetical protein